jgi:hypothetical protein
MSLISNWNYFFLMSLRYCLIASMIRAVTVVFISIARCLNSSRRSVGIFIVVLVSFPIVPSVPIYNIYMHTGIFMYSYMFKHTTILPYRSIHLYIIFRINMGMGNRTLRAKAATMVVTLAIALAMTTSTMTKQPFVFKDPKHCKTYEPSCYNVECNDSRQA